ncbi:laminin G domain containing protein [Nitzschia inconspicua]|uniref:Laminin G domain containing protein n=1 Tax=Nitzschia inconspicua TaxID=303405 RepID=A0A9K3KYV5_9STRA|nr:laminin G domain containing protein [Nitzschia inconspicua]
MTSSRWIVCWLVVFGKVTDGHDRRNGCPPTISPYPTETAAPSPSPSELPSISNAPTMTALPTATASQSPTTTPQPTGFPTESPAPSPSPSEVPTGTPSESNLPSTAPSSLPSKIPSSIPSDAPSTLPSFSPTLSAHPSLVPSTIPSDLPSNQPSKKPTFLPSGLPSSIPSDMPSEVPSTLPTSHPSSEPSSTPSDMPSEFPSTLPTTHPSTEPTSKPSVAPSMDPTNTFLPTTSPTLGTTSEPTPQPASSRIFGIDTPSPTMVSSTSLPNAVSHAPTSHALTTLLSNEPTSIQIDAMNITYISSPTMILLSPSAFPSGRPSFKPSSNPALDDIAQSSRTDRPTTPRIPENNQTTTEDVIVVTASSSVTLKEQKFTLNQRKIDVFESVSLEFLVDHYSRTVEEPAISFEFVKLVRQVPQSNDSRRILENEEGGGGGGDDDDSSESIAFQQAMDINVWFVVVGEIVPGKEFLFVDFERLVETIFEFNLNDFNQRLDNTGEFPPAAIEGSRKETNDQKAGIEPANEASFSIWMVASLGAVAFSVFLTAALVVGTVQRSRQSTMDPMNSRFGSGHSTPASENDLRSYSPSMENGLSVGLKEESLDGLNFIQSASSLKSGLSSLERRSIKDEYGSIVIPVEETNAILEKLSSSNSENQPGLNARMRKRLIEREVQSRGYEAGLSMEAILKATSSFNSEDEENERGVALCLSPIDMNQWQSDQNRSKKPAKDWMSNWFGLWGEKEETDIEIPQESRNQNFVTREPFQSSKGRNHGSHMRRENLRLSIPSKAEVISIGESVREEQYPISMTNWKIWDSTSDVRTSTKSEREENEEDQQNKKSPFKLFKPNLKKVVLRAIGRTGTEHKNPHQWSQQLSDDYEDVEDGSEQLQQQCGNFKISSSEVNDGNYRKSHRLQASTPVWMDQNSDNVIGIVHIGPSDSMTTVSRRSSHTSFPVSTGSAHRPHHPNIETDGTFMSSWRKPGQIKTDFAPTPLQRRLARARLDPLDRLNPIQYHRQVAGDDLGEHEKSTKKLNRQHNQENIPVIRAPSPKFSHLPHSSVRLVKKNSSLSEVSKSRKPYKVKEEHNTTGIPRTATINHRSGRIGATPMVEMAVDSNENAMILGSMENDYGGLELEWGLTI